MWFLKWWSKHDAQAEIIPDVLQVTEQVPGGPPKSFTTLRATLENFTKMYKWSKYHVLWIVKWHYQIRDHVLIRSHAVKWFDKYDKDRIIGFVFKEFPIESMKELEDQPSSSTSSIKDLLKGKSPEELAEIV